MVFVLSLALATACGAPKESKHDSKRSDPATADAGATGATDTVTVTEAGTDTDPAPQSPTTGPTAALQRVELAALKLVDTGAAFDPATTAILMLDAKGGVQLLSDKGLSQQLDPKTGRLTPAAGQEALDVEGKAYRLGTGDAWVLDDESVGVIPASSFDDNTDGRLVRRSLSMSQVTGGDVAHLIGIFLGGVVLATDTKLIVVQHKDEQLTVTRARLPDALFGEVKPRVAGLSADGQHVWTWTPKGLRVLVRAFDSTSGAPEWAVPPVGFVLPAGAHVASMLINPTMITTEKLSLPAPAIALTSEGTFLKGDVPEALQPAKK